MTDTMHCLTLPEGDYYAELSNIAALFDEPILKKRTNKKKVINLTIATQNLRGFAKKSRRKWINGWRRRRGRRQPDILLVQETSLRSEQEVNEIQEAWQRTWQLARTENPLSYWTITETRSAGVGILCSPKVSCKIKPWREEEWTSRIMAVEVDKWIVVNVYAPSDKGKKPAFFKGLNRWLKHHEGVIVGGDFNCVLRPNKDRVVARKPSTAGCESIELKELVDIHELTDAVEMNRDLDMEEEDNDPLQHYTFWRKDGASRLDRFYVKGEPMLVTQWVDVLNPAHDSDHQEVRLELATGTPQSRIHSMKPYYPIRSGRPQRIRDKIEANLVPLLDQFESSDHPVAEWDKLVTEIQEMLRVTRSRDRQQTDRYFKTLRAETRIPRSTRGEIMEDLAKSARRRASRSFGQRLIGSPEEIRRFYKRNSDWQRDQTISQIRPSAGHFYEDNYPIEERMASEWSHIFAKSHATATEEELDERLNHFVNIPEDIRVTKEETEALAAPITEFETWEAIQKLKRHKTAGTTGLNHDFYRDFGDQLTPSLTKLYNATMSGDGVPNSFLKATVVPLRKKGDSSDAMDYRPIALLNTAYKLFGRILAERMHKVLPKLISTSQQGFVRGRSIDKTVTILRAVLGQSESKPDTPWSNSPGVLCLDLQKAYDTLDRDYMVKILRRYGFSETFLNVIHQLHDGTTAQFQVNGKLSKEWGVNSGIRQGCPLAPLLFIIAVDSLSRAINQHQQLKGIAISDNQPIRHKFSSFVDDSTVYMSSLEELDQEKELLADFGSMSGLQVQPEKSILIGMNTNGTPVKWNGFPVLDPDESTRQLGYWVGNIDTSLENWEIRVNKIQKRLKIASSMSNSVNQRVLLFNAVALPSILYTGKQYLPSKAVMKLLENLQKQFVWHAKTSTAKSKHKLNTALVFAPRNDGGLGLQDIHSALQATRCNLADKWIQDEQDAYLVAWHESVHANKPCETSGCFFRPTEQHMLKEQLREKRGTPVTTSQAVGVAELWEAHSVGLVPSEVERDNIKSIISAGAARSSSYQLDEDKIRFSTQTITTRQLTAAQTEFLMNSQWNDNGCVINEKGKSLKENDYPAIRPTKIRDIVVDLEPERTMAGEYAATITVPMVEGKELRAHLRQAAKWCRNVMISIPWQAWDQDHSEIKAINQPQLSEKLTWRKGKERNTVAATTSRAGDTRQVLTVRRTQNGLSWEVEAVDDQFRRSPDYLLIEEWEFYRGIVFQATLETADYPWIQQQPGTAKTLSFILRKQRTKHFRRKSKHKMEPVLEQIKKFVSDSKWGNAASVQTPRQLWRTQGLFTDYQNWKIYRLALGKVNLYHAGWPEYRDCPALQCNCNEETIDHIMWECRRARAAWKIWIDRWMARETTQDELEVLLVNLASRQTPAITVNFMAAAQDCTTRWIEEHDVAMATLWQVWTTVTPVLLWRLRNKAVFEGVIYSTEEVQDIVWAAGYYQVTAIASAWQVKSATRVLGFCLETCMEIMDTIKKGMEIENIDRWLIRYYVKIDQNKLVSGAWMVFRFDGIGSWKLYAAGTVSESSQLGLKDNAQNILQRGIEAITKITEPKRVMLRVECWDAVSLRKTGAGRPKLKALFDRFFGIQWGKPKLKELHACKQLASANITSTHNFRNHSGTVLPSKPPWSAIARTQLDVSIAPLDPSTDNRKAESVYLHIRASIGEPHN